MFGILNFRWAKKARDIFLTQALRKDCEYVELEARIKKCDARLYRVYHGIPVVVVGVTDQLRNDRSIGVQISVLTGPGKGINHFMDPITDLALKKVVKDILNTKPWGIPWAGRLVPKDGVYWRKEFNLEEKDEK